VRVGERGDAIVAQGRPRQTIDEAGADWIGDDCEHNRHSAGRPKQLLHGTATGEDEVRAKREQCRRVFPNTVGIAPAPAIVDPHIATVGPAQLL
jgi:hypothetical protein